MTTPKEALELKPCPFCGKPPKVSESGWHVRIHCDNEHCGARVEVSGTERGIVLVSWNTRATTSLQGEDAAVVPDEATRDEDDAYEIGKRDGYEEAIQEMDLATGGDGEFKGSTIPGRTVDVQEMKTRIAARLRDDTQLKQCTICGFTIDTFFAAVKPTADFTTRGRAKVVPDDAAIRADEREKCAKVAERDCRTIAAKECGYEPDFYKHAKAVAAAIRSNGRGA